MKTKNYNENEFEIRLFPILFGPILLAFVIISSCNLLREYDIIQNGVKAFANITDSRKNNSNIEIQYQFSIENKLYSCSDIFRRKNLWTTIEEENISTVEVIYSQNNPWNNRLVREKQSQLKNSIFVFIVGILGLILCLFILLRMKRSGAKNKSEN